VGLYGLGNFSATLLILRPTQVLSAEGWTALSASAAAVLVYAAHNAANAVAAYPAGTVADRIGRRAVLVVGLRDRHGSIRAVAGLLQMPEATLRGHVYNRRRKRVPQAAKRISDLVLSHRKRADSLDMWEEQPGPRPVGSPLGPPPRRAQQ
jgi:hypothetical protein